MDDGQVPCTTKQRTVAKRMCISDDESESESDDDYGRKTARVYSGLPFSGSVKSSVLKCAAYVLWLLVFPAVW